MRYLALIERVEGNQAILKVGPGEYLVKYPLAYLPPVASGSIISIEVNVSPQAQQRNKNAEELVSRLLQMGVIDSRVKESDKDGLGQ